jgi:NAD(P)H-dependent FMN reductase
MVHLLSISGSLRASSSNTTLLRAAESLCPPGVVITQYLGLADLPHFNPDLLQETPLDVAALYARISQSDGLLVSCPEYARGIPGAFKNMLDWLVSFEGFPGMPVALYNASARARDAQRALRLVLETMSASIVEPASVTVNLLGTATSAEAVARDATVSEAIERSLEQMRAHITSRRARLQF